MAPVAYITHVMSFCAAHRLHNFDLSDEDNRKYFGKCNHISSHGHNYKIEVCVGGEVDPKFGYAMNMVDLKRMMAVVIDPLDHKRIDTDIEFFKQKGVIATAENIAIYIWEELKKMLPANVSLFNIRVHETEKNYVDYRG